MAGLRLERLVKRYGRLAVIRDLTLAVRDGEVCCLLGPSGCGKTTTLRLIAGLTRPDAGRVWIGDRDVTELSPRERRIGMMFQGYALYPHMTVWENIAYPLKVRGVPLRERRRRAEEVAAMLGLSEHLNVRVPFLSGGQQQRVALGRAIVQQPDLFLLDEPISALDARLRGQMREEIRRLQRRLGTTTVIVSHDQEDALVMADRIAVMRDGVVEQFGTVDEVYNEPANVFVAGFVGDPPMNFFTGRLVGDQGRLYLETDQGVLPLAGEGAGRLFGHLGERVTIGFRPQEVRLELHAEQHSDDLPLGTVDLVQRLGSESLYEVHVQGVRFRALAMTGLPATERPVVRWHLSRVHVFSADRGEALKTTDRHESTAARG